MRATRPAGLHQRLSLATCWKHLVYPCSLIRGQNWLLDGKYMSIRGTSTRQPLHPAGPALTLLPVAQPGQHVQGRGDLCLYPERCAHDGQAASERTSGNTSELHSPLLSSRTQRLRSAATPADGPVLPPHVLLGTRLTPRSQTSVVLLSWLWKTWGQNTSWLLQTPTVTERPNSHPGRALPSGHAPRKCLLLPPGRTRQLWVGV